MAEVKEESQQIPYRLADSSGAVKIKSSNAGKDFSPEEISAQVLRKLVDDAAKFLNDKVYTCSVLDIALPSVFDYATGSECASADSPLTAYLHSLHIH